MIRNKLIPSVSRFQRLLISPRCNSSSINLEKLEKEAAEVVEVVDEEAELREREIERKRDKSRLKQSDRLFLHEQDPYPEPQRWHHGTLKYLRRTYGRYGAASGVDPAICWPVKEELESAQEYERLAHPFKIPDMIEEAQQKRREQEEKVRARQEDIARKLLKLEDWKRELQNKIAKKEADAMAAKRKKERLVEEVRMHFGYTVDPRDEKFKEMLEKKEKEQKKADKEARKKAKEEQMLQRMLSKKTTADKSKASTSSNTNPSIAESDDKEKN